MNLVDVEAVGRSGALREQQQDLLLHPGEDPFGEQHELDMPEAFQQEAPDGRGVVDRQQLGREYQAEAPGGAQEQ